MRLALLALVLVFSRPPVFRASHSRFTPNPHKAAQVLRDVFGRRWRVAYCIARAESRFVLAARNGSNRGPFQINVEAHPSVKPWWLVHSWSYSARAAYRISDRGTDWSPWSTAGGCT